MSVVLRNAIIKCLEKEYKFVNVGFVIRGEQSFQIKLDECLDKDKQLLRHVVDQVFLDRQVDDAKIVWNRDRDSVSIPLKLLQPDDLNKLRLAFESHYPHPELHHPEDDVLTTEKAGLFTSIPSLTSEQLMRASFESVAPARGYNTVLIIGNSGACKSTLINVLKGSKLMRHRVAGTHTDIAVVSPGYYEYTRIGNGTESTTFNPVIIRDKELTVDGAIKKTAYIDLSGFGDSRLLGMSDEQKRPYQHYFANTFRLLSELSSSVQSIVITLTYESITQEEHGIDGHNPFDAILENLRACFGDINLADLNQHIITVITKVPSTKDSMYDCQRSIRSSLDKLNLKYSTNRVLPNNPKSELINLVIKSRLVMFDTFMDYTDSVPVHQQFEAAAAAMPRKGIDRSFFRTITSYDFNASLTTILRDIYTQQTSARDRLQDSRQQLRRSEEGADRKKLLLADIASKQSQRARLLQSPDKIIDKSYTRARHIFDRANSFSPLVVNDFSYSAWEVLTDESSTRLTNDGKALTGLTLAGAGALAGVMIGISITSAVSWAILVSAFSNATMVPTLPMWVMTAPWFSGSVIATTSLTTIFGTLYKVLVKGDVTYDKFEITKQTDHEGKVTTTIDFVPDIGTVSDIKIRFVIRPEDCLTIQAQIKALEADIARFTKEISDLEKEDIKPEVYEARLKAFIEALPRQLLELAQRRSFIDRLTSYSEYFAALLQEFKFDTPQSEPRPQQEQADQAAAAGVMQVVRVHVEQAAGLAQAAAVGAQPPGIR